MTPALSALAAALERLDEADVPSADESLPTSLVKLGLVVSAVRELKAAARALLAAPQAEPLFTVESLRGWYLGWLDGIAQRALAGVPAPTADEAATNFARNFLATMPTGEAHG